jgi:hypothetical protein
MGTQQTWKEKIIATYLLNTATPNLPGFTQWLYIAWARMSVDFPEPYQTTYDNLAFASAKRNSLTTLVAQNGAVNVVNNLIFNITPLGKLFKSAVSRS